MNDTPTTADPLVLEGVGRDYAKDRKAIRVLDGVSLSLRAGEFVSVQGASGCGKSTLLLLAGGLLRPTAGTVRLLGEDLYALSPAQRAARRARRIGFVFQRFCLIPYLSVRDNVLSATLGAAEGGLEARADRLIDGLGLGSRSTHHPAELSAGEQQRTALARALLHEPALVLADEPTGNLDPESARIVTRALAEAAAGGAAVVMATHSASAAEVATRHLRLDGGRLVEAGAAAAATQAPAGGVAVGV